MSLLDRLTPGERIDEQLDDHDKRIAENRDDIDAHGERLTVVERETPGVTPAERDFTTVNVADICEAGDDVAAAIREFCDGVTKVCHEFVLDGDRDHYWNSLLDTRELEYDHLEIRGEPQATVRVGPDVSLLARLSGPSHCLKNLRVDIRGDGCDAGIARVSTQENGVFENIRLTGQRDKYGAGGDRHTLRVNAVTEDATNTVRNVALPDGDTPYGDESRAGHAIAFSSESGHVGTNIWTGCYVKGFIDNAFYMSGGGGSNLLSGCRTKNIAGTHFRLGERDRAQDCHALQEASPGGHAWTGLWAERGSPTFEDCSITAADTCEQGGELLRDNSRGARWTDVDVTDRRPISQSRAIRFQASGRVDVERCSFVDRTDSDSDYFIYLKYGDAHFDRCRFDNHAEAGRNGLLAHTSSINSVSFDSCRWTGRGRLAIQVRDNAVNWRVRDCDFGDSWIRIPDGVLARGFQWSYNRCSGEDSLGDRCTEWTGAGTNWGFSHPGEPVSGGGSGGNW